MATVVSQHSCETMHTVGVTDVIVLAKEEHYVYVE